MGTLGTTSLLLEWGSGEELCQEQPSQGWEQEPGWSWGHDGCTRGWDALELVDVDAYPCQAGSAGIQNLAGKFSRAALHGEEGCARTCGAGRSTGVRVRRSPKAFPSPLCVPITSLPQTV